MPIEYELCYVAFLDILGWKGLVEKSVDDDTLRNDMAVALEENRPVNSIPGVAEPPLRSGIPIMTQFSDSIVVTASIGSGAPWTDDAYFRQLAITCRRMAQRSLFLRGGHADGPMYHKGNVAFGPALTAAWRLEQRALVPRIVVDEPWFAEDRMKKFGRDKGAYGLLRKAHDGVWHFDYLMYHPDWLGGPGDPRKDTAELLRAVWQPAIVAQLRNFYRAEEGEALKTLGKYVWLARYHNEVASEVESPLPIDIDAVVGDAKKAARAEEAALTVRR